MSSTASASSRKPPTAAYCAANRLRALPVIASSPKPIVAVVAGGSLYDAFAGKLQEAGMMVFREADRAMRSLGLYVQSRLAGRNLRRRSGRELAGELPENHGETAGMPAAGRKTCV